MNFDLESHLVLQVVAGSHAYGTAGEGSDRDLRGIIIPPEEYFYGLRGFEQFNPSEPDICYYDVRKFFTLALKGNPSVLEILWAPRMRVYHPFADTILSMRQQVLSKHIVKHHVGMAKQHLARLAEPGRKCGTKGKEAIAKYGYNTKDAAHVLRVLAQCIELLREKRLVFPRPEVITLREIREGQWSLEKVNQVAEGLLSAVNHAETASDLPDTPDEDLVSRNLCYLVHSWIYHNRAKTPANVMQRTFEEALGDSTNTKDTVQLLDT